MMYKCSLTGDVVIFLDFDGPLLPGRLHYQEFNSTIMFDVESHWQDDQALKRQVRFDPVMIHVLNRWIEHLDAKVVISSNWSKFATFEEICEILGANGFKHSDKIHDQWTTTKIKSWNRADEIANWLFNNLGKFSNYIIIDDDASVMHDSRLNPKKVLLIDFNDGLSFSQIFEGCEILGIVEYDKVLVDGYK